MWRSNLTFLLFSCIQVNKLTELDSAYMNDIISTATRYFVSACITLHGVASCPTIHYIVACSTIHHIIPCISMHGVFTSTAIHGIISTQAVHVVSASPAAHDIWGRGALKGVVGCTSLHTRELETHARQITSSTQVAGRELSVVR
jgi:hypothetical protein